MANFAELTVQLELQQSAFNKGMDSAAKQLAKIQKSASTSTKALAGMEKTMGTLAAAAGALASAFATFKGIEAIAEAGDKLRNLSGSFTALLGDAGRAGDMLGRIFAIVNTTGAPLEATAQAVQRLAIALEPLGASNAQIAQLAQNFLELGRVGGSSAEEVSGALVQLAQGLASGALGGDELKSIRENVPAVAKAIADGLGVPIGALKDMGEQGTLTADVVANALLKATAKIQDAFANLPVTLEQATNKMKAQTTIVLAEFDSASGINQTLVTLTDAVAKNLARWHSELVVSRESMTQMQTLADAVGFSVKLVAVTFVSIEFGVEQIVKRMTLWLQVAQALIDLDWDKATAAQARFNEQFDASVRLANQTIKDIFNPPAAQPPAKTEVPDPLKGGKGGAKGKGGGKSEAEREAEALKKQGEALAASVDPLNAYNQKLAEYTMLLDKAAISDVTFSKAVEKAKEDLTAAGDALTASVDPAFAYELAMRKINQAYRDGQIEVETWVKLQEKAKAQMDDAMGKKEKSPVQQLTEDVATAIGAGIGDFFKDVISGSLTAEQAFAKMVKSIISDLAKLLAEFAAKQISGFIIKTLFGSGASAGGAAGASANALLASLPAPSWNAARSLAVSPLAGAASPTGAQAVGGTGANGGGPWQVTINNNAPGVDVTTAPGANGSLEVTVAKVRALLTQDVARGGNPFARSLESAYGLGRGR